ncbi:MAG TPA: hypothetical protein VMW53_06945 [archaeon]|nr:hypothetical protein [archaeon]
MQIKRERYDEFYIFGCGKKFTFKLIVDLLNVNFELFIPKLSILDELFSDSSTRLNSSTKPKKKELNTKNTIIIIIIIMMIMSQLEVL